MWTPSAGMASRLSAAHNEPRLAIEIDGWATFYLNGTVTGWSSTRKALATVRKFEAGESDLIAGTFELGQLEFSLVDVDGELLSLLATDKTSPALGSLAQRRVNLKLGFLDLAEADWVTLRTYVIDVVEMNRYGEYDFRCVAPMVEVERDLWAGFGETAQTQLEAAMLGGATQLWVDQNDGFVIGDTVLLQASSSAAPTFHTVTAVGDAPKSGTDESTRTDYITVTPALASNSGKGRWVNRCWALEGHPINIIARVLLDDFAAVGTIQTNFPLTAVYGTIPAGSGVGIDPTLIDTDQWKAERDTHGADLTGRYVITRASEPARSVLHGLLNGLGSIYVTQAGKIAFRLLRLSLAPLGATIPTLVATNSAAWTWARRFDEVVNSITVIGNIVGQRTHTILTSTDAGVANVRDRREAVFSTTWLWSDLSGDRYAQYLVDQVIPRLKTGPQYLTGEAFFDAVVYEPMDAIALTHPELPDTRTGGTLTGRRIEVTNVAVDPLTQKVRLFARTGSFPRAGRWAPDALVDYAGATQAEKDNYVAFCDEDGLIGSDDGYCWG